MKRFTGYGADEGDLETGYLTPDIKTDYDLPEGYDRFSEFSARERKVFNSNVKG